MSKERTAQTRWPGRRIGLLLLTIIAACEKQHTIVDPPAAIAWVASPSVAAPGDTVELRASRAAESRLPTDVRIGTASLPIVVDSSMKLVKFLVPLIAPGEQTLSLFEGGTALGSVRLRVQPLPIVQGQRDAIQRVGRSLEVARHRLDTLQMEATTADQPEIDTQAAELRAMLDSASLLFAMLGPAQLDTAEAVLRMLQRVSGGGARTTATSFNSANRSTAGRRDQVAICNGINDVVDTVEGVGEIAEYAGLAAGIAGVLLAIPTGGASLAVTIALTAETTALAAGVWASASAVAVRTLSYHVPAPASLGGSLYLDFTPADGGIGTEVTPRTIMRLVPLSGTMDDGALLKDVVGLFPVQSRRHLEATNAVAKTLLEIAKKLADWAAPKGTAKLAQLIDRIGSFSVRSRVRIVTQVADPSDFGNVEYSTTSSELRRQDDGAFMLRVLTLVGANELRTFSPTWEGTTPATPQCQPVARQPDPVKGINAFTLTPRTVTLQLTIPRLWVLGQADESSDESGIGVVNRLPVPLDLSLSLLPPAQGTGTRVELTTTRLALGPKETLKYNSANAPRVRVTAKPGTGRQILAIPIIARLGATVVACEVVEATIDPPGGTVVEEDALTFTIGGGSSAPNGKMAARLTWNGTSSVVQWPVGDQVTVSRTLRDGPNDLQLSIVQGSGIASYRLPQPFGTGTSTNFSYAVHQKKFFRLRYRAPSTAEQQSGIDAAYAACEKYGF